MFLKRLKDPNLLGKSTAVNVNILEQFSLHSQRDLTTTVVNELHKTYIDYRYADVASFPLKTVCVGYLGTVFLKWIYYS